MVGGEKWIIANWKANKDLKEALEWIDAVGSKIPNNSNLKVVVCPDFICVEEIKKRIQVGNYPLLVGVQDLSPFDEGPYTGEEAASLLQDLVDLAILGHSERRQNFNETDEVVSQKVEEAKKYNIIPLVCLESLDTPVPEGVSLVAYEPPQAIGSGEPESPEVADEVASAIKQKYGDFIQVLYGGSVSSENTSEFLKQPNLAGLLVGHSSLDPVEFVKIVAQYGVSVN